MPLPESIDYSDDPDCALCAAEPRGGPREHRHVSGPDTEVGRAFREIYAQRIGELIAHKQSSMRAFLDDSYVQPTRWARWKARLRNLWYDARHALCCGACKTEDW